MPTTYQAIATVTVGSGGAANIVFTSIPQTFTDLVLKISTRTLTAGTADALGVYLNGVQTNRSRISLGGNGSSVASGSSTYRDLGASNGNGSTANTFSNIELYFPNYTSSNYKSISSDSVYENNATAAEASFYAGLWSVTTAITAITLDSASAGVNFMQYSSATLYGIKNS
jgi:hypothetical protein